MIMITIDGRWEYERVAYLVYFHVPYPILDTTN